MIEAAKTLADKIEAADNLSSWKLYSQSSCARQTDLSIAEKALIVAALRAYPAATQDREALRAAIRAAKLALFVINKHGVMLNSSWQSGFDADLKTAEAALAPPDDKGLSVPRAESGDAT